MLDQLERHRPAAPMVARPWLGLCCLALIAAACAADSEGGAGPAAADPKSPAEEATPTTSTPGSSTTTSAVEPPTTAASLTQPETAEDPSPDEPSATSPPTEEAPIASADKPPAEDGSADLQPQDNDAESDPDATPGDEESSDAASDAPKTWQGIPVITVAGAATTETEGVVRAPLMLSRFDDVEVLLHNQDRAWTFGPDGSIAHEWSFQDAVSTVFPDGAGGIVHSVGGIDYLYESDAILHVSNPGSDPTVLVGCSDRCDWLWLLGVTTLGDSTEVIYTQNLIPELDENASFHPTDIETLHRFSLNTHESMSLVKVGAHEWWLGNTSIAGAELFGHWWTDGGNGLVGYDLQTGSIVHGDPGFPAYGESRRGVNCFDIGLRLQCPGHLSPANDGLVAAFSKYITNDRILVVSTHDRDSGRNRFTIPIVVPESINGLHSIRVWGSVLIINTLTREGYPGHRPGGHPHHAVLINLETQEAELYSHPGVLRLVPSLPLTQPEPPPTTEPAPLTQPEPEPLADSPCTSPTVVLCNANQPGQPEGPASWDWELSGDHLMKCERVASAFRVGVAIPLFPTINYSH